MPDKKPTEMRSEEHLDRVDRLIAERRGEAFDDPEEITSREQVEEIARIAAKDAVRATMPTPVQVVISERHSSTPPSVRARNTKLGALGGLLLGIAAVLTALSQCAHDVPAIKHPAPAMHEAK